MFKLTKDDPTVRLIQHIPVGGFAMWLSSWTPAMAVTFALIFVFGYEITQDFHIKDGAYRDIKGMLWGMVLVSLAMRIDISSYIMKLF